MLYALVLIMCFGTEEHGRCDRYVLDNNLTWEDCQQQASPLRANPLRVCLREDGN